MTAYRSTLFYYHYTTDKKFVKRFREIGGAFFILKRRRSYVRQDKTAEKC